MFFDSSFEIFGCARIVTLVFLALEDIDVIHIRSSPTTLLRAALRSSFATQHEELRRALLRSAPLKLRRTL